MRYQMFAYGDAAHRSSNETGAELFIVDCQEIDGLIMHADLTALEGLKTRLQGLRSKTTDNGCTEVLHNANSADMRPGARSAFRWTTVSTPSRTFAIAAFGERRANQAMPAMYSSASRPISKSHLT